MIYLYKCPIHGEFEVEQRITDPKIKSCARPVSMRWADGTHHLGWCGEPVERLISRGTSFVLKGSGWAKDGYR